MIRQHACRFLCLLLLATVAVAQTPEISPPPSRESGQPFYVAPADAALDRILAPPPAVGSAAYKRDVQALLDMQRTRTDADVADAQADAEISFLRFADVLGPELRADKLPVTVKFLRQIGTDAGRATGLAKKHFARPRPSRENAEIVPVLGNAGGESYPSGHATFGYTAGILLAMMVPEKAPELFERAARYGRNRNVGGVHYPTDIEAGRTAASVVVALALRNPKFVADLEQSKTELRAVLGLK